MNIKKLVLEKKDNYRLIGKIMDQKLLAAFYSLSDLFLLCSLCENFPTTCIEAQCCGSVISGFNIGGAKETLIEDKGLKNESLFVEYGDIEALAEITEGVLSKNIDREELSKKAKKKYSSQRMSMEYLNLYKELV